MQKHSFAHTFCAKIKQGRLQKGGASITSPKKEHHHGWAVHDYGINSHPLVATSLQWVGRGRWRRILFYFVNWSRNKLISKSIHYNLVIHNLSQQFDPPNDGITSHPFVVAQCVVSPTSPPLLPPTFGWGLADGMQQGGKAAVGVCVAGVNLHADQRWRRRRRDADGGGGGGVGNAATK